MNRPKQYKQTVSGYGLLTKAVVVYVGLAWSWLFASSVSELSGSVFTGYLYAMSAFVILVGLTTYIYVKAIIYFHKRFLSSKQPSGWVLPLLFLLWSAVEFIVAHLSALIWIGRDGSFDTVVPLSSFAPLAAHTPLAYLSRLVGFYGLSAVVGLLITVFCLKNLRRFTAMVAGSILLISIGSWLVYRQPDGEAINVLIASERLSEYTNVPTGNYQLAVFPEYGLSTSLSGAQRLPDANSRQVFYVGSKQERADTGHFNTLEFGSSSVGILEARPKSRLIMGGEYLPYFAEFTLKIAGADNNLTYFESLKAVQKGRPNYQPLLVDENTRLGSAVCSSIIAPEDYRKFTTNGATVLTNSASLGIFNSELFSFQHRGLAKFMAVANARPFLQSSNDADAFAVDHNGRMLARISPTNFEEVSISTNRTITPYSLLGEWPAYVGLAIMATMLFQKLKQKSTKGKELA